ncbi:WYL domain-containing protein [Paenibacillus durus]|uniref:WYL domain-containing protein n=1 Tax=Paenibacillus durus TaxID=44251 RepID=UPI0004B1EA29
MRHYRIDRIHHLDARDQTFNRVDFDVSVYLGRLFNMYSGEVKEIVLHVHNHLINGKNY